MSNLEELIERLCPDGVEYKEINDCTIKVQNIKWKSYVGEDKQYIDLSSVDRERNIITETQNINADTAPSRAQQIVMKDDIILGTTRPMLKRYCIIPEKYDGEICSTGFCVLRAKTDIINPRWLYHNITTKNFFAYVEKNQQGASYPAISDTIVKAFKLPVPPLEVQREIVRILDNFTFLTTELAARQKQYEYYRDLLLTFKPNESTILNERTNELELSGAIRWMKLGDIAEVSDYVANGSFATIRDNVQYKRNPDYAMLIRTVDFSNGFSKENAVYIDKHAYDFLKKSKLYGGEIIINNIGAGVGTVFKCPKLDVPMSLAPNAIMVKTPYNDFYYYWLQSKQGQSAIEKIVAKSAMPKFNKTGFRNINIPVPPLEVQQRIVDILDRFDTLCNDISSGLPAEIEMRQKQYEYYRDKLLTFKELKKEA